VSFPGFHTNPRYWATVVIGGHVILAVLREVDGMKLEGDWSEQKPTGTSGASFAWKGLKPAGPHKLTFETANYPGVTAKQCEDDMRVVHEMMLPQPSLGAAPTASTTPTATPATPAAPATPTTAEGLLAQAQQALANLNNPATQANPTAGTTGTSSSSSAAKTDANPGPRPPTLSIDNGFVNYVGTTAISLKSFEVKPTKTNSLQFILELVPQKALKPAGTGLAPPKSPDQGQGLSPAQRAQAQAAAADALALSAGAGT
jgi:hypothetical protein